MCTGSNCRKWLSYEEVLLLRTWIEDFLKKVKAVSYLAYLHRTVKRT